MLLQQHADVGSILLLGGVGKARIGGRGGPREQEEDQRFRAHNHTESGFNSSLIVPWLSAKWSICTPTFSSSVRCRLASGVGLSYRMCRPPFILPAPPPATRIGRFT